jgi:lyso-ornithine lipid O-acyltransferase
VSLRAARRAVALGCALALCFLRYWALRMRGPLSLERRALWLQDASRIVLASLGIHVHVQGTPPRGGLVVSNHLSYLDIPILSSVMPCFFVSKVEVGRWPYFGKAARAGGTMFLDRSSMSSAGDVAAEISERLSLPIPILLFPEGTSTDGSAVLEFHTRLFDPAVRAAAPVTAAAVRYTFAEGSQEMDLCWFGDQSFLPHLWKALGASGFTGEVCFGEPRIYPHRRIAATQTHAEATTMRSGNLVLQ